MVTACLEMGLSREALGKLTENHAMPWCFLLFPTALLKNCVSQGIHKTSLKASHVPWALLVWFFWPWSLLGLLCTGLFLHWWLLSSNPFNCRNAERFRMHIRDILYLHNPRQIMLFYAQVLRLYNALCYIAINSNRLDEVHQAVHWHF